MTDEIPKTPDAPTTIILFIPTHQFPFLSYYMNMKEEVPLFKVLPTNQITYP